METSDDQNLYEANTSLTLIEMTPILVPYFLGFFIFRGFFANFPLYLQIKFGKTDIEVVNEWAIISGIALLFGALTRIPAGLLSDKIGRKKAFIAAYLIYGISLAIIVLFQLNLIYIIGLSSVRFGLNLIAMSGRGVVSTSYRDTGLKNGLLSSMVGFGSFVGPALLAWILDNYPADYIIYASIIIIMLDLILFTLMLGIMPLVFSKLAPKDKIDLNLEPVDSLKYVKDFSFLKIRGVQEAYFLFFAAGMIFGLITSVYTIYGFNVLGLNLSYLGFITGAGSLAQAIWAPIVGKLYQYVKDEYMRLFAWTLVLSATVFMFLSSRGEFYFITGYFLLNFGNASYLTMEITRLNKTVKVEQFSLVFGIATSLIILGTSIAGFVSPPFYEQSREGTFFASVIMALLAFFLVLRSTSKAIIKAKGSDKTTYPKIIDH